MHPFYERMKAVFRAEGSNRRQFCLKRGYNYQTLQSYWNTDKLPPGNVLADLADEYHVSLDTLVLGRTATVAPTDEPRLARLYVMLTQLSDENLLRVEGAIRMLQLLDGEWEELEELPPAD
jgi:hypothetical protein